MTIFGGTVLQIDAAEGGALKDVLDRLGPEAVVYNVVERLPLSGILAITAWVMTAFSGVDGIRMMSNLGGFPALFIASGLNIALILLGTKLLTHVKS